MLGDDEAGTLSESLERGDLVFGEGKGALFHSLDFEYLANAFLAFCASSIRRLVCRS
jgi:hypothetical protein